MFFHPEYFRSLISLLSLPYFASLVFINCPIVSNSTLLNRGKTSEGLSIPILHRRETVPSYNGKGRWTIRERDILSFQHFRLSMTIEVIRVDEVVIREIEETHLREKIRVSHIDEHSYLKLSYL